MSSPTWHTANSAELPPEPINPDASFTLSSAAKTDIWRRSAADSVFNAPIVYRKFRASQFKRLSATVFAPWRTQYDQAGIVLMFPGGGKTSSSASIAKTATTEEGDEEKLDPPKWIKAGIEYFSSAPVLGVVGCDRLADWSLCPMRGDLHQKATLVLERKESTVWVYGKQEGSEGGLVPLREIKWAFPEGGEDDEEVWAGVYVAKPTPEDDDAEKRLEVTFEGVEIEADE